MNSKRNNEKTPVVVADSGWAETLPEWIMKEIQAERLIGGMCEITGKKKIEDWERVGDAEVCAYLYTASLKGSLDSDLVIVYVNLLSDLMERRKDGSAEAARELAEPMTDWQKEKLRDLKGRLFRARGGKVKHPVLEILSELRKQALKPRKRHKHETLKKNKGKGDGARVGESG